MIKMKQILILVNLLLVLFFSPLLQATTLGELDVRKGIYLIIHAMDAVAQQDAKDKSTYHLTVTQPHILYFYDRPWHTEGQATPVELMQAWHKNFIDYGSKTYPNATWLIDPQNKIDLLNIIIYDVQYQSEQLHFSVKEVKKNNLDHYLHKHMKDSVLIFTLP